MIKRGQAALEFLLTYGWAFMIMIAVIAGFVMFDPLSYSGVSQPTCSSSQLFICEEDRFQVSPRGLIGFTFTNRGPQQLSIQNFSVSRSDIEDYGDVVCETPVTFKRGSRQNIRCEGIQGLVEGERYSFNYEARVYSSNLGEDYSYTVQGEASTRVKETDNLAYLNQTDPSYFTFTLSGSEATLTGYDSAGGTDIIIPETYEGNPVTHIDGGFGGDTVTSISFPSTLKSINSWVFHNKDIEVVSLPSGFETAGANSFKDNNIHTVSIPSSFTQIANDMFRNNEITSLTIPSGVEKIGGWSFGNNEITSLTLPDSVESVGSRSFLGNEITSVDFPSNPSFNTIPEWTFRWNNIDTLTIPSSVNTIEENAFGSNPIDEAFLPAGMTIEGSSDATLGSNNLAPFYISNGAQSGTYTYNGSSWTRS